MKLQVIFLLTLLCPSFAMIASSPSHSCLESKQKSPDRVSTTANVPAPNSVPTQASTAAVTTTESLIANVEITVISKAIYNVLILTGKSQTDYFLARDQDGSLASTLKQDYDLAQLVCNNAFTAQMKRNEEELATEERQIRLQESADIVRKYSPSQLLENKTPSTLQNALTIYPHQLQSYNTKQQAVLKAIIDTHVERLKELDAQHEAGVQALLITAKRAAENKQFFHEQHEMTKPKGSSISYNHELQNPQIYATQENYEQKLRSITKEQATKNK